MARPDREESLLPLFGRLASGDLNALAGLYDRCASELYGLALWRTGNEADAADAVQDVFVRLASAAAALSAVKRPRAYLLGMAHRAAVDRLRARRGDAPLPADRLLEAPAGRPEALLDAARVSKLLTRLPPPQREAIYLRHFADLSFREIGKATGSSTFTAASRYRLGIRRLRRLMGEES